jgi:hypothetical protein
MVSYPVTPTPINGIALTAKTEVAADCCRTPDASFAVLQMACLLYQDWMPPVT